MDSLLLLSKSPCTLPAVETSGKLYQCRQHFRLSLKKEDQAYFLSREITISSLRSSPVVSSFSLPSVEPTKSSYLDDVSLIMSLKALTLIVKVRSLKISSDFTRNRTSRIFSSNRSIKWCVHIPRYLLFLFDNNHINVLEVKQAIYLVIRAYINLCIPD